MSAKLDLKKQVASVPDKPGVYIFRDEQGEILYIGKGKTLRRRMASYFRGYAKFQPRTALMVRKIAAFDFQVTANEVEALILEANLIKEHRPQYNVFLRDDKSYPWITLTLKDRFARLTITRDKHIKGNVYFGPYTNVTMIRETLDTLRKIFPLRTCRGSEPGRRNGAPCLNYHIKKCLGPCIGAVNEEEYRRMIRQITDFLEGRPKHVLRRLESEMKTAAERLEFENAARIRNQIAAAQKMAERQVAIIGRDIDLDVIGQAQSEMISSIQLLQIRSGRMVGTQSFILLNSEDDVISAFIKQYYLDATLLPHEVLLPRAIDDQELIAEWLKTGKSRTIKLRIPSRGKNKRLLALAADNAAYALELAVRKQLEDEGEVNKALVQLRDSLGLKQMPERIECFDVSNISGAAAVSSMAVFEGGRLMPSAYRKFKIRLTQTPNDFEMMRETIKRRLLKLDDPRFGAKPDLILVDGGKPQLSAALSAGIETGFTDIEFASLAKREEEVFIPNRSVPVRLERRSPGLNLIIRLRDEAHRFAIQYHRRLRSKSMTGSELDLISGIGPKRRGLLIKKFGSLEGIINASIEELELVLPKKTARIVYEYFAGRTKTASV